jgi:alkanesulfonate monooxygenase SsuD/methylene tetrahydromethanopterin reductase-like flavin-dependent oxidoreductase (luciferase family)
VLDGLLRGPLTHRGPRFQIDAELRPRPVQAPRPPIWVAGVAPHRRPLARALRFDGIVPIGPGDLLTPDQLDDYLAGVERPDGWDVVANWAPGVAAADYAAVGATWLVDGVWPTGDWVDDLRGRIKAAPGG